MKNLSRKETQEHLILRGTRKQTQLTMKPGKGLPSWRYLYLLRDNKVIYLLYKEGGKSIFKVLRVWEVWVKKY